MSLWIVVLRHLPIASIRYQWLPMTTFLLHSDKILATFWLQSDYILSTFCLHSGYILDKILTTFWLLFCYILTAFWIHSDYILTTSWLHPDYILITFWSHSDYILITPFAILRVMCQIGPKVWIGVSEKKPKSLFQYVPQKSAFNSDIH